MKISKQRLKEIIKEELSRVLDETDDDAMERGRQQRAAFGDIERRARQRAQQQKLQRQDRSADQDAPKKATPKPRQLPPNDPGYRTPRQRAIDDENELRAAIARARARDFPDEELKDTRRTDLPYLDEDITEDAFDDAWRARLPDVSKAAETERAAATPTAKEERLKDQMVRRILELMPSLSGSYELLMKKKLGDLQQMARSLGGN